MTRLNARPPHRAAMEKKGDDMQLTGKVAGMIAAGAGWSLLAIGLGLDQAGLRFGATVTTVGGWVIATGLALAIIGTTERGFGALDRFFGEILARTRRAAPRIEPTFEADQTMTQALAPPQPAETAGAHDHRPRLPAQEQRAIPQEPRQIAQEPPYAQEPRAFAHEQRAYADAPRAFAHEQRALVHDTRPPQDARAPAYDPRMGAYDQRPIAHEARAPAYDPRAAMAQEQRALMAQEPRPVTHDPRTLAQDQRGYGQVRRAAATRDLRALASSNSYADAYGESYDDEALDAPTPRAATRARPAPERPLPRADVSPRPRPAPDRVPPTYAPPASAPPAQAPARQRLAPGADAYPIDAPQPARAAAAAAAAGLDPRQTRQTPEHSDPARAFEELLDWAAMDARRPDLMDAAGAPAEAARASAGAFYPSPAAPANLDTPRAGVIEEGEIAGHAYRVLADLTVEVDTLLGARTFDSMEAARRFVGAPERGAPARGARLGQGWVA